MNDYKYKEIFLLSVTGKYFNSNVPRPKANYLFLCLSPKLDGKDTVRVEFEKILKYFKFPFFIALQNSSHKYNFISVISYLLSVVDVYIRT